MRLDTATLGGLFDVQLPRATVNNVAGNDNQVRESRAAQRLL